MQNTEYKLTAGLETHAELSTQSKIFCGCSTEFGSDPNTHCCPICMGMPGTLPSLNQAVVKYAVMAGLALHCSINLVSRMARKNYCYPDLPKAYQISQAKYPLCENGYIDLQNGHRIRIKRIHIEEDAGKLIHENDSVLIDYNRCGIPLIEIVTEPDITSPEEAREYVEELQMILRYIDVSDCRMQEGSLRCDVNISLCREGESLGTRTEIKNMNSLSNMVKAIRYETERQKEILCHGGAVQKETLRYDAALNKTFPMRGKEGEEDYRYFTEPDIPSIVLTSEEVGKIESKLPELPRKKYFRYTKEQHIPDADAQLLIKYRKIAEYFEEASAELKNPSIIANWILGPIFSHFSTETEKEKCNIPFPAAYLKNLAVLLEDKKIGMNLAKQILQQMLDTGKVATAFLTEKDLTGLSEDELKKLCKDVICQMPNAVEDYKNGKEKALKALLGSVMRFSKGRADAKTAEKLLITYLSR